MISLRMVVLVCSLLTGWASGQAETLRDPTQPMNNKGTSGSNGEGLTADGFPMVKIEAVFLQGESKRAVINGQTLVEGQNWKGFSLLEIHPNGVILSNTQRQKEFLINNNNFLKDTTDDF